jgi:hypothetical protein
MINKNKKGNNMTFEDVSKWLQKAKKGDKTVYFTGFLVKKADGNHELKKLIKFINEMCTSKVIDVVHKKISGMRSDPKSSWLVHPEDKNKEIIYEYIIQKR